MVLDFCPFGCLLSSFSAAFGRFPSFQLRVVFLFGCFLSISVLLAAFCLLFGCLVGPAGSLRSPVNIGFEIYGFGFPSFWLPFVFLFGCFWSISVLLSSLWLPCWARCSLRSPLNIGFEIYGFGFLSFWLPFVFLFGCFLSISVLLAAFCLLFGCLVGPAAPSAVP